MKLRLTFLCRYSTEANGDVYIWRGSDGVKYGRTVDSFWGKP